jgi:hypothetical protein
MCFEKECSIRIGTLIHGDFPDVKKQSQTTVLTHIREKEGVGLSKAPIIWVRGFRYCNPESTVVSDKGP